jgi:hypothetical protein
MRPLASCVVLIVTAASGLAQIESGPGTGKTLTPVTVYAPLGPRAGLEFDAAGAIGDGPGALLIVPELTRNIAPLIRGLDELTSKYRPLGLTAFTVLLAADRTAAERQIQASSKALRMTHPMVVSVDGAEGPGDWALNRRVTATLVLTNAGKVHRSIAFTDTGRQDLDPLRNAIEEVTGRWTDDPGTLRRLALERLPQDQAALRALAAQLALELSWQTRTAAVTEAATDRARMRRDRAAVDEPPGDAASDRPARPREGARPTDPALEGLLRRAIRKDADSAEIDAVFAAVDERVRDDAALEQQAVEMFKLMLSLDYGADAAKERARAFVRTHAKR